MPKNRLVICLIGDSDSAILEWYLRLCKSIKLPDNVDAAGPGPSLQVARMESTSTSCRVTRLTKLNVKAFYCFAHNYRESFCYLILTSRQISADIVDQQFDDQVFFIKLSSEYYKYFSHNNFRNCIILFYVILFRINFSTTSHSF